ncbi:MAG: cation:proton antiporter [Rhodospirillales bacterium]|nr:cation:proton antiporter [Rhodospirillales bacterium]
MLETSIFLQIVTIMALAGSVGLVAVLLRQPLIVAFIITGLLAGPDALNLVREQDKSIIETLAQFGIALLLFVVGLKLDLRIIRQMGLVALATGLVQIIITCALGFTLSMMLGYPPVTAAFIGLALAFSSTIIAVKLLSDAHAIDSLYGRLALGILIVQDLMVIIATIIIAGLTGESDVTSFNLNDVMLVASKAVMLVAGTGLFIRFAARPLTHILARNSELMVVFCFAFAVIMAALCEYLHFSKELGGLVAGIALASTPYNNFMAARLSSLRDFLLLFFFAHLGAHMSLAGITEQILPALLLSIFVLAGKPLVIMSITNIMHFRKRTGFLTGMSLSQISEFSLILIAMGYECGLVGEDALNLVTLVGLLTMTLSTYAITHMNGLYNVLERHTGLFIEEQDDRETGQTPHHTAMETPYDVIVFGLGHYGEAIAHSFQKNGYSVLGVDFNPSAITTAQEKGIPSIYGDAADPEFPAQLPLHKAKVVVLCFQHTLNSPMIVDLRRTLSQTLRVHGYQGHIAATSHHLELDRDLPSHGIDIVLKTYEDAAHRGTEQIIQALQDDNR